MVEKKRALSSCQSIYSEKWREDGILAGRQTEPWATSRQKVVVAPTSLPPNLSEPFSYIDTTKTQGSHQKLAKSFKIHNRQNLT